MRGKRHKPEEIVAKLRQVDVLASHGQSVADAVRAIGHRGHVLSGASGVWRAEERPGSKSEDLEAENARSSPGGLRPDAGQDDPDRGRTGNF
jgi:putative transposase